MYTPDFSFTVKIKRRTKKKEGKDACLASSLNYGEMLGQKNKESIRQTEKEIMKLFPEVCSFPVKRGTSRTFFREIALAVEALKDYYKINCEARGRRSEEDTVFSAIPALRRLFLLEGGEELDAVLIKRIITEYKSIYSRRKY